MRTFFSFLVLSFFLFAGCESVEDRWSPTPPKTQVFDGDQARVLAAALQAFRRLDLRVLKSSSAHIEAASRIHSSEPFGNSRQLLIEIHLSEGGPGKTVVEMTATEEVASQSPGGTSESALHDNGFFTTYFSTLQQVLQEGAGADAPEKK